MRCRIAANRNCAPGTAVAGVSSGRGVGFSVVLLLATLALAVLVCPVSRAEAEAVPAVTGISPSRGPTEGGTTVVISGTGLQDPTSVSFGETEATSFSYDPETGSVTAVSPPHEAGTVSVRVTTAQGISEATAESAFTFLAVPVVTGVSPTTGTAAGGTQVTISGLHLAEVIAVFFGDSPAAEFAYDPATGTVCAVAPPHAAGQVQVKVTTTGGASKDTPADDFTFVPPPPTAWYEQADPRIQYSGTW